MAVDIAGIEALYDSLEAKLEGTLDKQWKLNRVSGPEYAAILTEGLVALLQVSTATVQQQPNTEKDLEVKDAQILDMKVKDYALLANTQKDIEYKDGQILLITEQIETEDAKQTSMGVDDTVKSAQSAADLTVKAAQAGLIDKQALTEVAKELLVDRQAAHYDDKANQYKWDASANVIGMVGASGADVSSQVSDLLNAIGIATTP